MEVKKKLMQNLGYCPFEHKAGHVGTQAGALGRRRALRRDSRRKARAARRPGRGLGLLLGQHAVHSVHSACFDPVSTQYCS